MCYELLFREEPRSARYLETWHKEDFLKKLLNKAKMNTETFNKVDNLCNTIMGLKIIKYAASSDFYEQPARFVNLIEDAFTCIDKNSAVATKSPSHDAREIFKRVFNKHKKALISELDEEIEKLNKQVEEL